jgi:hypothetical protein
MNIQQQAALKHKKENIQDDEKLEKQSKRKKEDIRGNIRIAIIIITCILLIIIISQKYC